MMVERLENWPVNDSPKLYKDAGTPSGPGAELVLTDFNALFSSSNIIGLLKYSFSSLFNALFLVPVWLLGTEIDLGLLPGFRVPYHEP